MPKPSRKSEPIISDDLAIAAVASYWEARDAFDDLRREDRKAFFFLTGAYRHRDAGAVKIIGAMKDEIVRHVCEAGRKRDAVTTALSLVKPATPRGAIEMLTVALAEFPTQWSDHGRAMVMGSAEGLEMIRRVRDALELWTGGDSTLPATDFP
jgi:hypothetical protein